RYTRREVLAAFADSQQLKLPTWREGVRWLPDAKVDLLAITIDKTSDHFSPTTRYRDYAISPSLLHWESQSTTSASSLAGRRYQEHSNICTTFLSMDGMTPADRAFYIFGPAW